MTTDAGGSPPPRAAHAADEDDDEGGDADGDGDGDCGTKQLTGRDGGCLCTKYRDVYVVTTRPVGALLLIL